ncbi:MAPEG family protein [Uliginosibacterium sp. H3]|uniref:MAPEG family protein n=1 Tax=Uliginosibacterium silvisoli TaxID=3114758 RepID=A0ABU6K719_9RHOO|nr:MAPEG family protein [Uliginosibacterium sp. H3]
MNIAFLSIVIACFMPLILTVIAKSGGARDKRYDNSEPRVWLGDLAGWPRRANAAQQNSWEALPIFVAGVLMAAHSQVPQGTLDFWAVWFIVARVIYAILYIANQSSLRSLVWALALLAPLRLMIAAI